MTCSSLHGKAGLNDLARDLEFLDSISLFPEVYLSAERLDTLSGEDLSTMLRWREEGKGVTFHAPFVDLSPGGFDPKVLEVTRFRFFQTMELAEKVGPQRIVFHPGFDDFRFAFREDLWIENSLQVWEELLEAAARIPTRICLENVFDKRPDHLGRLRERLGEELGFCLDTGHYLIFSQVPLQEWLDAFSDGLCELHLHDNDGRQDLHQPVGEGTFDFTTLCREIQDRDLDPVIVLEHHSREETTRSLKNFQQMILEK